MWLRISNSNHRKGSVGAHKSIRSLACLKKPNTKRLLRSQPWPITFGQGCFLKLHAFLAKMRLALFYQLPFIVPSASLAHIKSGPVTCTPIWSFLSKSGQGSQISIKEGSRPPWMGSIESNRHCHGDDLCRSPRRSRTFAGAWAGEWTSRPIVWITKTVVYTGAATARGNWNRDRRLSFPFHARQRRLKKANKARDRREHLGKSATQPACYTCLLRELPVTVYISHVRVQRSSCHIAFENLLRFNV